MRKTLHLDAFSGVAGDMWLGALVDAGLPVRDLNGDLAALRAGVSVRTRRVRRAGLSALQVRVLTPTAPQPARGLADIRRLVGRSRLPASVRRRAQEVFQALAEAEARVHGCPVAKVHFHEVGALDAIADVVGVTAGLERLGVEEITVSSVNVGSGTMACAHGRLPVPAPATVELLRGYPVFADGPAMEMTTPTGAALVRALAKPASWPRAVPERTGYGAGSRDPRGWPNVLRAVLCRGGVSLDGWEQDEVVVLSTRVDDATPEVLGYVVDRLMEAGALDAAVRPAGMKKNRMGQELEVVAAPGREPELLTVMFAETGTLGVRVQPVRRALLARRTVEVRVRGQRVRCQRGLLHGQVAVVAPEYEDAKLCARRTGLPLRQVQDEARRRAKETA